MLNNMQAKFFPLKEVALENMDLLPETLEKVIYFVSNARRKAKIFSILDLQ
jgi:hypothetical protein